MKPTPPLVELLEIGQTGAMIAWYEKQSMEVVLTILHDLARAHAGAAPDGPVELRPNWSTVPSVFASSRDEFVRCAPAILGPEFRYCESTLFVAGREVFVVRYLDQSLAGIAFNLWDDTGGAITEKFSTLLNDALRKAPKRFPQIEFLLERLDATF